MDILYRPIGVIRSPFTDPESMPVQPIGAESARGVIEVDPSYEEGLRDLDGFTHLILIYHFHKSRPCRLTITPFLDTQSRGLFSTRAPSRPNPVGLSIVELLGVDGNRLSVAKLDILDGTPLLDIKPYVPEFDSRPDAVGGWFEKARGAAATKLSDGRFKA
jgi:tRNA-Thr(GGU) m(6)t(6)A37 methyltransferase TsaA